MTDDEQKDLNNKNKRDDFPMKIKRTLAARVAYKCSNSGYKAQTSGPQIKPDKALNIGV